MRNDLRDTWVYQEILREGREMAREEMRRSKLEWQRKWLNAFIEKHYPEIADMARNKGDAIADPDVLYEILMKVILAKTQEEIAAVLESTA